MDVWLNQIHLTKLSSSGNIKKHIPVDPIEGMSRICAGAYGRRATGATIISTIVTKGLVSRRFQNAIPKVCEI